MHFLVTLSGRNHSEIFPLADQRAESRLSRGTDVKDEKNLQLMNVKGYHINFRRTGKNKKCTGRIGGSNPDRRNEFFQMSFFFSPLLSYLGDCEILNAQTCKYSMQR